MLVISITYQLIIFVIRQYNSTILLITNLYSILFEYITNYYKVRLPICFPVFAVHYELHAYNMAEYESKQGKYFIARSNLNNCCITISGKTVFL